MRIMFLATASSEASELLGQLGGAGVMNAIETKNLTKIYKSKYIALNGANLSVPQGAVFGLVGPNGAGKTTTIRLLLGLHTPTAGTVRVFGQPMTPNATDLRRRIGFLPTNPRFPPNMNPIGYLDFVGKLFGLPAEIRSPRLAALLRAVDLLLASAQKVSSFSTGMTTRLGIAASLMNDPDLLLWDEPTAGLDPAGRRHTLDLIEELGQSKTILVSSHNLNDIKRVCSHVGVLSEGKLIFNGPLRDMGRYAQPATIELELDGDLTAVRAALDARHADITQDYGTSALRLTFESSEAVASGLAAVLATLGELPVALVGIQSLNDEMVDTFIRLLEEERAHGFSRIFDGAPQDDALSGDSSGRPA
jgi:ABC-2 type transport system ATP-binding protein